ncbi:hypothetical protein AVEN_105048-1 [Araneus ventricosus]|uniref:Uncharacterized protein n=1 Tax=Araneus ventricosus TaxID=182803 RepID=A0A4Y2RLA5_ARAVE|nr:hypothetical protein AVEN_105048-1 [Araneus ventricosus]
MLLFVLVGESLFSFFLIETSLKSVKSGEANASSLTGATDGEEEIGKLVTGGDALAIESGGLELQIEISGFFGRMVGRAVPRIRSVFPLAVNTLLCTGAISAFMPDFCTTGARVATFVIPPWSSIYPWKGLSFWNRGISGPNNAISDILGSITNVGR